MLIQKNGQTIGSVLIGQGFSGPAYFHSCPSAPRNGYDAANDNGSQFETINQTLTDRVKGEVATAEADNPGVPVPTELMTASALGIDPHITPAAAEFQLPESRRSGARASTGYIRCLPNTLSRE